MKVEMQGQEPLYFVFGLPICTAVIVLGAFALGCYLTRIVSVQVAPAITQVTVSPKVSVNVPEGAIIARVETAPVQIEIREIIKEVVKVSPVTVQNQIPQNAAPTINVNIPDRLNVALADMPKLDFEPVSKLIKMLETDRLDGVRLPPPKER